MVLFRSNLYAGSSRGLSLLLVALVGLSVLGKAENKLQEPPPSSAKKDSYVFKPVKVEPSPAGVSYTGRFIFINKAKSPLMLSGFDAPIQGKFEPRFVQYQTLQKGGWKDIKIGYCGTGAEAFAMEPDKPYEFHVGLSAFKEQTRPLTVRVGLDGYWSDPFVLNWTKDRNNGRFAAAKKEHFEKLRSAFSKAGFKEDLLVGDDFCSRLLQSMMKPTQNADHAGSFRPFVGKLEVTPGFELDGRIRIDFHSDEVRQFDTEYRGWIWLDPKTFSPQWFRSATLKHVKVSRWGRGMAMELSDGNSWDSPLHLQVQYVPFGTAKAPSEEAAEKLFREILAVLAGSLKERL